MDLAYWIAGRCGSIPPMTAKLVVCLMPALCLAQNYKAEQTTDHGVPIVRLTDAANGVDVSIIPSIGNRAYEMKVHGKNVLYFPQADAAEFQARPRLSGIPFLAPWADLLSESGFWANGKHYTFNMGLGNVRGEMPSHGLLVTSPYWKVTEAAADARSAHVTSKLEFWRYPDLVAQWPFAHEYEMTYRLADGTLEVLTTITNVSTEAMPIVAGYHPYLRIPDTSREDWLIRMPAKTHVIPGEHNIPTGEMRPLDVPNPLPVRGRTSDDGFTDFVRDTNGQAVFSIEFDGKAVDVLLGPKYTVATIWFPELRPGQRQDFVCIEPLTTIIAGLNLAKEGKWSGLQTIPAGGNWTESFWIRTRGL